MRSGFRSSYASPEVSRRGVDTKVANWVRRVRQYIMDDVYCTQHDSDGLQETDLVSPTCTFLTFPLVLWPIWLYIYTAHTGRYTGSPSMIWLSSTCSFENWEQHQCPAVDLRFSPDVMTTEQINITDYCCRGPMLYTWSVFYLLIKSGENLSWKPWC